MSVRVAIVGIGWETPLGDLEEGWSNLLAGRSAPLSSHYQSAFQNDWEGDIPEIKLINKLSVIADQTVSNAFNDAGLELSRLTDKDRIGSVIGTSKGPLEKYGQTDHKLYLMDLLPSSPGSYIHSRYQLTGPLLCPVSACATGLEAVWRGVRLLQHGDCDLVIAGSVDASVNDYVMHSYRRLGVLADASLPADKACRPFDKNRSGFVVGEGGAMFVLMRTDHPAFDPSHAYAYWDGAVGYSDPTGMTQLDPEATTLTRLLGDLIIRGNTSTREIDLLHLHGTGTPANDLAESRAIARVFGPPDQQPLCTASKGQHGHALGAAGSIELAWTLLAMQRGIVPPIANLKELDPACAINAVQGKPVQKPIQKAVKISLGFGGHQVGCLLSKGERVVQN